MLNLKPNISLETLRELKQSVYNLNHIINIKMLDGDESPDDSIDDIIKDFSLIGFSLIERSESTISFKDTFSKETLRIDKNDGKVTYMDPQSTKSITVFRSMTCLINRLLRLWGFEIC